LDLRGLLLRQGKGGRDREREEKGDKVKGGEEKGRKGEGRRKREKEEKWVGRRRPGPIHFYDEVYAYAR